MASNYGMSQYQSLNANQQNEIKRIATENAGDQTLRDTKINEAMALYTAPSTPAQARPQVQQPQPQQQANTVSDGTGNTVRMDQPQAPSTPQQYPQGTTTPTQPQTPQQQPKTGQEGAKQPEPPKVLTQDEVFNSVVSGTALPDNIKRSPLYREVMKRKSNVDMVNAMNPQDLVTAEASGTISSSALNDLRLVNPAKYAQFAQIKERKNKMESINSVTNTGYDIVSGGMAGNKSAAQTYADQVTASIRKTEEETMNKLKAMADEFKKKGEEYEQKFAAVVRNDPSVKEGLADLKQKKEALTSIDARIASLSADVRAELSSKNVPESYIYAVIAQRTRDLTAQRTAAATVYNGALDNLKTDLDMASGQYDAFIKGEGVAQSFAEKLYDSQERAYDDSMKFAIGAAQDVFAGKQAIEQSEAEFNQKIEQQNQLATDPVMATQQMLDEFKKINVIADRSDSEIIEDIKSKVAAGKSIGQALSELKSAFMSKPSYKEWARANQTGQVTEREKLDLQQKYELQRMGVQNAYDLQKLASQQKYNGLITDKDQMKFYQDMLNSGATVSAARSALRSLTGDWRGASANELADAPDGTLIPTTLSETTNKNGGMECAEWLNRSYGTTFPSSLTGKQAMATETEGGIGKAMVWQPTNNPELAQYGHVGVIIGESGDNWIVKSSNLKGDGRISIDQIPKSTQARYKTLEGVNKAGTAEQPIIPKKADTQTQNQKIATMENARKVIMDKLGGKNFDTVVTAANDITALGKSPNATDKMAVIFKFMKSLDPTSTVRETEYQAAASSLGLEGSYESFVEGLKGKNIDPSLMDKYALTAITTALVSARDYKSKRDAVINSYKQMGADVSSVEDLTQVQGMKDVGKEAGVLLGKLIDSKQITAQQADDFLDKFGEFID